MRDWVVLAMLAACRTPDPVPAAVDLTEVLGPGQVRAGVVTDESALFGGSAAEGRAGDLKIYNDRVQFVIQGARSGSHLAHQGGGVIDADLVRPGEPGRDTVTEWMTMAGVGHVPEATLVEVVSDGQEGAAIIRVHGVETPFEYVTGALEAPELIPDWGLAFTTDYILEPDTWLLEVVTTVTATDGDVSTNLGDVLLAAKEVAGLWGQGVGLTGSVPEDASVVGLVGHRSEVAVALLGAPGDTRQPNAGLDVFNFLITVAGAFGDIVDIEEGESVTFRRYYAVGPDMATLTDAWLSLDGQPATQTVSGVVSAADGPVEGARVNVLGDGAVYTVAHSDADGAFAALVPDGMTVTTLADGRGYGYHTDLPAGAGPYSPYASASARDAALASMAGGSGAQPQAWGRGVATADDPLTLGVPGTVVVAVDDGKPFSVRLTRLDAEVTAAEGLVQPRPDGYGGLGWSRDGEVELVVEPGAYRLLAHRGLVHEVHEEEVEVVAGQVLRVDASLPAAYEHPGWMIGDAHMHAAPSPDGGITMADRLVVSAASGLQLHFGTDHDHVVDYGPLIEPLGLKGTLATVIASEMSPLIRGHVNVYPLQSEPEADNGGAWLWWRNPVETTDDEFAAIREAYGETILQMNHPMSGVASFAGWTPGNVERADFWTTDFDAIEVLNGGSYSEPFALYLDMIARGHLCAPTGVSDSHGYTSGDPGINVTFLGLGTDDPASYDPAGLVEAMKARRTIVSLGPYLELSVEPGSTVSGSTTLEVTSRSPSWITVDRLALWRDGVVVQEISGTTASFDLAPDTDAFYVVSAHGDTPMEPVSSELPWAFASAILVDVAGDGWTPPLPPLTVE